MDGYGPQTYGARWADVYDEWYQDISDVDATVHRIATLAGEGRVLELGIGTGRLALPLAAAGVDVSGIDSSPDMVARLAAKPGGDVIAVVVGDMEQLPFRAEPPFAVVFAAFNTFFNLDSEAAQRRCMNRVAQVLAPGGRFVVEGFVPTDEPAEPESDVAARTIELDRVVLTVTRRDPDRQTIVGQHVEIRPSGIELRPWVLRYARPPELDAMAEAAGLELADRWAGWCEEPYDPDGPAHVSVYRRPAP